MLLLSVAAGIDWSIYRHDSSDSTRSRVEIPRGLFPRAESVNDASQRVDNACPPLIKDSRLSSPLILQTFWLIQPSNQGWSHPSSPLISSEFASSANRSVFATVRTGASQLVHDSISIRRIKLCSNQTRWLSRRTSSLFKKKKKKTRSRWKNTHIDRRTLFRIVWLAWGVAAEVARGVDAFSMLLPHLRRFRPPALSCFLQFAPRDTGTYSSKGPTPGRLKIVTLRKKERRSREKYVRNCSPE